MAIRLSVLLLLAFPTFAFAQSGAPLCPAPGGAEETGDLAALPASVAASLKQYVPNLSQPGSPFNGGDALGPGQTQLDRRLIAAFHRDRRWVIAYEAAGIGYHDVVVAYDLSPDGHATIASKTQSFPGNVCGTVADALNSKGGKIDRYW